MKTVTCARPFFLPTKVIDPSTVSSTSIQMWPSGWARACDIQYSCSRNLFVTRSSRGWWLHLFFWTSFNSCNYPTLTTPTTKTLFNTENMDARTEVERHTLHLNEVETKQPGEDKHEMYSLIIGCLQDEPHFRPSCADIFFSVMCLLMYRLHNYYTILRRYFAIASPLKTRISVYFCCLYNSVHTKRMTT